MSATGFVSSTRELRYSVKRLAFEMGQNQTDPTAEKDGELREPVQITEEDDEPDDW